jgi:hypothetical protein
LKPLRNLTRTHRLSLPFLKITLQNRNCRETRLARPVRF